MHTARLSLCAFLTTALVGLLGACEQPSTSDVDQTDEGVVRLGSVEAVDTLARAVAPNDRPLVIDGFRGAVDLRGAAQETAELRFVRRGRGEDAETARGVLEDVTVTESGSQDSYTYTLETDGAAYAAVDVSGTVPAGTELRVERSSGPVSIAGVEGPITIRHEHGPVTLRGVGGSVDVEIRNGDIAVGAATVPTDATLRLRTANGDVTLGLPPAASTQLSAETSAGTIRTRGLALTEEQFSPRDAGGRYTAQLGAGAASAELRTENGSILIGAADTVLGAPAAAPPAAPEEAPDAPAVPPSDTTVAAPPADTADAPATGPDSPEPDTTSPDAAASGTAQSRAEEGA